MKKLTLILISLLGALAAMAQTSEGFDRMILRFNDGSTEEFSLTEDVAVVPKFDKVEIHVAGYIYTYNREDLRTITYHELISGIEDVTVDDDNSVRINDDNMVAFNGIYNDNRVQVYSTDGRMIKTFEISPDTNHVDFSDLPHGIYIVRCNNQSYKIRVR